MSLDQLGKTVGTLNCLQNLLAPLVPDKFANEYWHKQPVYRSGGNRNRYNSLFRIEQLDDILNAAAPNGGDFDFFTAGTAIPQTQVRGLGNYVHLNRLLGSYAKGGTIHLSNAQKYSVSLGEFCKRLQNELMFDCESDIWMTRKSELPPFLHFDKYDIFSLQIYGRKRWRLYAPMQIEAGRISAALQWEAVAEPLIDVIVEPGDLIYLPRYTPHVVTTVEAHSVHVGIGLHPITWREFLVHALDASRESPGKLDEIVPLDFMRTVRDRPADAVQCALKRAFAAVTAVNPTSIAERVFDSFLDNVTHARDEHVTKDVLGLLDDTEITNESKVTLRTGTVGRSFISAGRAFLNYSGGGVLSGPPTYLTALKFIIESTEPFSASCLDSSMPLEERVALVVRAVQAGLCRRV